MAPSPAAVKKAREAHQVSPPKPNPYVAACPTRTVLDRIADKWTAPLLDQSPLRFNQLRRADEGLSRKILSQTLKALERDGLVTVAAIATAPVTVDCAITPLEQALAPIARRAGGHSGEILSARERYDLQNAAKATSFAPSTSMRAGT